MLLTFLALFSSRLVPMEKRARRIICSAVKHKLTRSERICKWLEPAIAWTESMSLKLCRRQEKGRKLWLPKWRSESSPSQVSEGRKVVNLNWLTPQNVSEESLSLLLTKFIWRLPMFIEHLSCNRRPPIWHLNLPRLFSTSVPSNKKEINSLPKINRTDAKWWVVIARSDDGAK